MCDMKARCCSSGWLSLRWAFYWCRTLSLCHWGSNFMLFQVDISTFAMIRLKYNISLSYRVKVFTPSSFSRLVVPCMHLWCTQRLPDMGYPCHITWRYEHFVSEKYCTHRNERYSCEYPCTCASTTSASSDVGCLKKSLMNKKKMMDKQMIRLLSIGISVEMYFSYLGSVVVWKTLE